MALLQVCFLQKAAGFCLLLQMVFLTHWDLVLTSRRENYAETFCNVIQGVCSCHCLLSCFCNSLRCQIKHGMLLFRTLCVLHDVRCSWGLWRSSLGVQHHIVLLNCDISWWKHLFRLLKLLCAVAGKEWVFGWWLGSEAWNQVKPAVIVSFKLWTLSTVSMGALERLVINLCVAFRDGYFILIQIHILC